MSILKSIAVGAWLLGIVGYLTVSAAMVESDGYRAFAAVAILFVAWLIGFSYRTAREHFND